MYIPTIILAIITIILSAYNTKKDKTHKDEIYNLRKTMEAQHKLELSEQKERLENLHKTEILKLNEELSKTKDGTLIPELEANIAELNKQITLQQKSISHLVSLLPSEENDEYLDEGTEENNKKETIPLNQELEDEIYWFIMDIVLSLEEFARDNDSTFNNCYQILDLAFYLNLMYYQDIKEKMGFKEAVIFFDNANNNIKNALSNISQTFIQQFYHHRYSAYNSITLHYKNVSIKKQKMKELLASFLYFDDKIASNELFYYDIDNIDDLDDEEDKESFLSNYFPEDRFNISNDEKDIALNYINEVSSYAINQNIDTILKITKLLEEL